MFTEVDPHGLVILIGPPGVGKSTLASLAFRDDEVVSTDQVRESMGIRPRLDSDEPTEVCVGGIVATRLARGLRTVVDSTASSETMIRTLINAAEDAGVGVVGIDLRYESRQSDAFLERHAPGLSATRALELADLCHETSYFLSNSGFQVLSLDEFFPRRARGSHLFLGMPVTENIGASGFRKDKRKYYERIHNALTLGGFKVASAGVNEQYGTINLEPNVFTKYDVEEIARADVFLVTTPSTLSPDVYLEIGLASGAGTPVGLVLPAGGRYTQMMRGMIELGHVTKVESERDTDIPRLGLQLALDLVPRALD